MITELASVVLFTGIMCYYTEPRSICAIGMWITSVIIATLAVVAQENYCEVDRMLIIAALLIFSLFAEGATVQIYLKLKKDTDV